MGGGGSPNGLLCPGCGAGLRPPGATAPDVAELTCPECGERFRARRRESKSGEVDAVKPAESPLAGSTGLVMRGLALEAVEWAYRGGTLLGAATMLALGGFVPV